jgi:hypothetical protein
MMICAHWFTPRVAPQWLGIGLALLVGASVGSVMAEPLPVPDSELGEINAKGDILVGSYSWTDDHSFDSSINKGALILDGNAQQFVTGENVVTATQSAVATGVTMVGGDITTGEGSVISLTNTNEATTYIGGF